LLVEAHRKLDRAAFAEYGWPVTLANVELLERLLALKHECAAASHVEMTMCRVVAHVNGPENLVVVQFEISIVHQRSKLGVDSRHDSQI
jgi:hypothetical protein